MIIMHEQDIENLSHWQPFGLELKLLGISFTSYYANTSQIPVKTHFSVTFSSPVSSDASN